MFCLSWLQIIEQAILENVFQNMWITNEFLDYNWFINNHTEIDSQMGLSLKILLIKIVSFNLNSSVYRNFSEDWNSKMEKEIVIFKLSQPVLVYFHMSLSSMGILYGSQNPKGWLLEAFATFIVTACFLCLWNYWKSYFYVILNRILLAKY